MAVEPGVAALQFLGADADPAAMALQPALKPLLVHQPPDPVPGKGAEHRAQQPSQHHRHQGELAAAHIEAPQGHDQLRGNRWEQVLQEHGREDGGIACGRVGLDRRADQLGELLHKIEGQDLDLHLWERCLTIVCWHESQGPRQATRANQE